MDEGDRSRRAIIIMSVCLASLIAIVTSRAAFPGDLGLAAVIAVSMLLIIIGALDGGLSNTLVLFTIGYGLYNTSLLVSHAVFGLTEFALGVQLAEPELSRFCTYVVAGALITGGTYMALRLLTPLRRRTTSIINRDRTAPEYEKALALVLIMTGVVVAQPFLAAVGGFRGLVELPYVTRHLALRGWGMSTAGVYLINAGFVLLYVYCIKRGRGARLFFYSLMVCYVLALMATGRRGPMFLLGVSLFVAHDSLIAPAKFRVTVPLAALATVLLLIIGRIRSLAGSWLPSTVVGNILHNFEWSWFDPGRTEWASASLVMMILLRLVPWSYPYAEGRTYLEGLLSLVPARLWASRPELPSTWFARELFPDVYVQGGGFGFSLLGEAYLNFGPLGIALCSCLVGLLLFVSEAVSKRASREGALFYALIAPYLILLPRLDFGSFLKGVLVSGVAPYMLMWGAARASIMFGSAKVSRTPPAGCTAPHDPRRWPRGQR